MTDYALSLDIGGSHISSALIDLNARAVLESSIVRELVNESSSAEGLVEVWTSAALRSVSGRSISHVGIAMPAPFDYAKGISKLKHKFAALYGLNVHDLLRSSLALDVPLFFANDANLFALGEWWAGAAQQKQRVIGITLGTGLGCGFIENGRILTKDKRVPPNGEIWNLPYKNSLAEDYVSGTALVANFKQKTGQPLSGKGLAGLARQGNKAALACFDTLGQDLNAILNPHISSFAPDCIVLGGNLSKAFDLFAPSLTRNQKGMLVLSEKFEKASLLGAAALHGVR